MIVWLSVERALLKQAILESNLINLVSGDRSGLTGKFKPNSRSTHRESQLEATAGWGTRAWAYSRLSRLNHHVHTTPSRCQRADGN